MVCDKAARAWRVATASVIALTLAATGGAAAAQERRPGRRGSSNGVTR